MYKFSRRLDHFFAKYLHKLLFPLNIFYKLYFPKDILILFFFLYEYFVKNGSGLRLILIKYKIEFFYI